VPTTMIDFNEIADGVTDILNARASRAQAAQCESDRLAREQVQRGAEQAAKAQRAAIVAEFARLGALQQSVKTEIEEKRAAHTALTRELPVLSQRLSATLAELATMRARYPFLKG
jgi:predicted  nucleic acid-binding Zn-ribbon protein